MKRENFEDQSERNREKKAYNVSIDEEIGRLKNVI